MSSTKTLPAAPKPANPPTASATPKAVAVVVPGVTRLRAWPKSVVPPKASKTTKVEVVQNESVTQPDEAAEEPVESAETEPSADLTTIGRRTIRPSDTEPESPPPA